MIKDEDLAPISAVTTSVEVSAQHVHAGMPIPKIIRVSTFSPDEWEQFVEEWASSLEKDYDTVRRLGGSGDYGVDVVGFCDGEKKFSGVWDSYQCKRLNSPMAPSQVWVEIGKIIYYSFKQEYSPPRRNYFICSKGIGTSLERLLGDAIRLKDQTRDNWEKYCKDGISSVNENPLTGDLLEYFENFDFSVFSSKSVLDIINEHSDTSYHTIRFGGGLPARPDSVKAPEIPTESESVYIRHILDAYGEKLNQDNVDLTTLESEKELNDHFLRQRERFYHAEGLRNFARDTVPRGTFESLQEEIFQGVVDLCSMSYQHGFDRLQKTMMHAGTLSPTANPLFTAIKIQDKQGICHQLANEDKLKWKNK